MSRWRFHSIPRVAVLSYRQYKCHCLRPTQVTKISSSLMAGFIRCCGGWKSTTMQVPNASMIISCSQRCILTRKPRPGSMIMSKVSTIGDGCGPSKTSSQVCMINSYMSCPYRTWHRSFILWSTPQMVVYMDSIMNSNTTHQGWSMRLIHTHLTPS